MHTKTKRKQYQKQKKTTSQGRLRAIAKFLPAIILFTIAGSLYGGGNHGTSTATAQLPAQAVLSYATSMSVSDLLAQTNTQRSGNNVASLSLNGQLNNAAQAKANDMVTRNYWSHNTPDGQEPWVFIAQAGYQYKTAGENLAYGFDTAAYTVTGWMNSPPHRQNLLNSAFQDVGFGFANSANYVNDGPQTVVVAMYGAPLSQSSPAPAVTVPSANSSQPQTKPATSSPAPAAEPIQTPAAEQPTGAESKNQKQQTEQPKSEATANTRTPVARTADVRRIQILTGGNARWSSTLLVVAVCAVGVVWALQRGRQIRHLIQNGEHFILRHLHIDFTILGIVALGWTLLQTSGVVR
jgi:uncharacterized protein YkwD